MILKNKKILITAGPTWSAIDTVRVISNTATGTTGILLAKALIRSGAKVTLLLGPGIDRDLPDKARVVRFRFFDELEKLMSAELSTRGYDAIIHSAAVSDYKLKKTFGAKIRSDRDDLSLKLVKTPKLIQRIKKIDPLILAIGFKFQPQADKTALLKKARILQKQANLDIVIANTLTGDKYQAYIINHEFVSKEMRNKKDLARNLIKHLAKT
ncbi:MAG: phosphopantothenoylcysteine decarboxylase [Candidatus Omnitrophica bacterium]|jgi:phosphopantothenoylcysteine decarboxylase/phosphopantothenate--cysteine ligase|nr:phosphopantothenoylcysteine decarboxylase [Candidatus Omnitrophota bacterium]MDD5079205.1 phosphopantothenoylcysteine decarboxylase [Candidatus Omnitrophota bacterium]